MGKQKLLFVSPNGGRNRKKISSSSSSISSLSLRSSANSALSHSAASQASLMALDGANTKPFSTVTRRRSYSHSRPPWVSMSCWNHLTSSLSSSSSPIHEEFDRENINFDFLMHHLPTSDNLVTSMEDTTDLSSDDQEMFQQDDSLCSEDKEILAHHSTPTFRIPSCTSTSSSASSSPAVMHQNTNKPLNAGLAIMQHNKSNNNVSNNSARRPSLAAMMVGLDSYFDQTCTTTITAPLACSPSPSNRSGSGLSVHTSQQHTFIQPVSSVVTSYSDVDITYCLLNGSEMEAIHQTVVLEQHLGAGQFADVYKARINNSIESVAIKILKPRLTQAERSFEREVRSLKATIDMPGTLDIIGYRPAPHYWIITPFMMGGTLQSRVMGSRMNSESMMSIPEIIDIAIQIARTMQDLHERGIMHRDLTTENVMLKRADDLEICLADFGVAVEVDVQSAPMSEGEEAPPMVLSTNGHPRYRAPEVMSGLYSLSAEVYNFGSCLYEMTTGCKPLEDIPDSQVAMMISRGLRPLLPSQHSTMQEKVLVDLIMGCMVDQANLRPSWTKIIEELQRVQELCC